MFMFLIGQTVFVCRKGYFRYLEKFPALQRQVHLWVGCHVKQENTLQVG
uniref:Uncharacterized protein n=1 Tax=Anguilla anguilla TaxID=7936 RepID=A0A0E9QU74_ANGAN